jgi:hypothetical protein
MSATQNTGNTTRGTTSIRMDTLRRARIAARLEDKSMTDFISELVDAATLPLLKRHGLNPDGPLAGK